MTIVEAEDIVRTYFDERCHKNYGALIGAVVNILDAFEDAKKGRILIRCEAFCMAFSGDKKRYYRIAVNVKTKAIEGMQEVTEADKLIQEGPK